MPAPQDHPEVGYYRGYCREKLGHSGARRLRGRVAMSTTYVFPQRAWTLPVLQRAVAANPRGRHGALPPGLLVPVGRDGRPGGGRVGGGAAPATPRSRSSTATSVSTLLHALGQAGARASRCCAEGTGRSRQRRGLPGARPGPGPPRPSGRRAGPALEAYPHPEALPGALVFKRALALVEAGRFDEAEALFAGRFFAREEFGTNVRQVWVEVEVQKALALARRGTTATSARQQAEGLGREDPGLAFTQDGLEPFVERRAHPVPASGELFARVRRRRRRARRAWEKAAPRHRRLSPTRTWPSLISRPRTPR